MMRANCEEFRKILSSPHSCIVFFVDSQIDPSRRPCHIEMQEAFE
jgi:hypothetical protein